MKPGRGGFRMLSREQLMPAGADDSYRSNRKYPTPTRCPQCGATFRKGRWSWSAAAGDSHAALCPACRRINDKFPAGYVTLRGEYLGEHADQVISIAKRCERTEHAEHPLQRIMAIETTPEGVSITTTDAHLARRIAEQIHDACKGSLALHYSNKENLLRATWSR
jgi:NMD protein affecting ribosome stability and mRNA decay